MRNARIIFTLLALISAVIYITAEYAGSPVMYFFKPLTMLAIIAIAFINSCRQRGNYGKVLIAGLVCSMAGDIFLMLPANYFVAGLISFLIAHIFYIVAFTQGRAFRGSVWWIASFVIYGIFIFWLLEPYLGHLLWPVVVYIGVILIMGWQAAERWNHLRDTGALLALVGAIFFIVSDSVLAYNKFRASIEFGRALNLSTYFLAQWLIAWSIRPKLAE